MEFVTLHELSKEFDLPARVVRYRFHQLRRTGKLKEIEDWRRDEYVDEQHFVWQINPLSFMRETGLHPVSQRESSIPSPDAITETEPVVNKSVNETRVPVNNVVNQAKAPVTTPPMNVNNTHAKEAPRDFEHDVIDFLKEQVRVKDGQLRERDDQLRALNDMNVKLMGATLQQAKKIEDLLRLAPAKADIVAKDGNQSNDTGSSVGYQGAESDSESVNQPGSQQGTTHAL
jgi:hypothetical protein